MAMKHHLRGVTGLVSNASELYDVVPVSPKASLPKLSHFHGFSVGYGRLFGWFQAMSWTPRYFKTSNMAFP